MTRHIPPTAIADDLIELLDDATALSLDQLARGCRMAPDWVLARVQAGVLTAETAPGGSSGSGQWRFASATLVRARRIAHLEHTFDADPQLAALAADLMEEVASLRRQLDLLGQRAHAPQD